MAITIERVSPGDLIRSGDYNEVAQALEALDARVTALEAGSGEVGPGPVITDVTPDEPTERTVMEIHGRNFAVPASLNTITLDAAEITEVLPGSSDQLLRSVVPADLTGLPRNMTLTVQTSEGHASRTVRILPETETPSGQPIVNDITSGIGTIAAGSTYTFIFRLDAAPVSIAETYRLDAIYSSVVGASRQQWEDATDFVGAAGDEVTVDPVTPVSVGVQVTVPAGATSVMLTLRAISTRNDPGSSRSSAPVPIVVGQDQPENDPRISLYLSEVGADMQAVEDNGELVLEIAYPVGGATSRDVLVPIEARFAVAGTYDYAADVADHGTLWTLGAVTPVNSTETAGGGQQINIALTLNATAPAAERRNLTLRATRRETTGPGRIATSMVLPVQGFGP